MDEIAQLYESYYQVVFRYLIRLSGSRPLAEELAQDTFVVAMDTWKNYRGDSSIPTWLCGIAKNLYRQAMRKEKFTLPLDETLPDTRPDLAERLVRKDQRLQLMGYLHDLDEPYREVFTLYTFCDLKLKEIAQLFGKTDSWARVTYYRARQKLANMIKEKEHGNEQFAGYK